MNFLVIGAQKAGTTWLYKRLGELDEFDLVPIKELHYFDRADRYPSYSLLRESSLFKRVLNFKWINSVLGDIYKSLLKGEASDLKWKWKYYFSHYSDEWYLSLFENQKGISGDFTPAYSILDKEDVERIYKLLPDIKLVFMIRNPIERVWSSFKFANRGKSSDTLTISEFIRFANYPGQELRSDYLRTVEVFKSVYPKEQIMVGFYDAIIDQPYRLLFEIVNFIGGESKNILSQCNLKERNNASRKLELPIEAEKYLWSKYGDTIQLIADRFGNYSLNWLNKEERKGNHSPVIYF